VAANVVLSVMISIMLWRTKGHIPHSRCSDIEQQSERFWCDRILVRSRGRATVGGARETTKPPTSTQRVWE